MAAVALRVPSVEALFDAWSPEPLERRPLADEARQRILDAWLEASRHKRRPERLELTFPAGERSEDSERSILAAIRRDMETMRVEARHHWIRRCFAPRESRIGLLVFLLALVVASALDYGAEEGSVYTVLSQTFVVLAWVALWGPAYRMITAASFRLGRRSFEQLAGADIEIRWA